MDRSLLEWESLWLPLAGLILLMTALFPPSSEGARLVDRIAAVVNDEVITLTELEQKLQRSIQQLRRRVGKGRLPSRKILRRQLLERMILNRIQLQRAQERDIQISAQALDKAVSRIAQQNGLSMDRFRRVLSRRGVDYADYRQKLREKLRRERLINQAVRSQVHVTDEEVASFLARHGSSSEPRYEYKLQHILVAVPEEAPPEKAENLRRQANQLRERIIEEGEKFAKVAAAESDGQNALEGGNLGWFKPGELPSAVAAEIEGVEPNHLSRVIRTPSGFHLFKVTDRRKLETTKETQVKARHIMLRVGSGRSSDQARALAQELKNRLKSGANFTQLATQFSEGPAAREGGNLGWVSRGELVPGLEELLFSLAPGQIGGPVRTQLGIHIAKVLNKREKAVNPENKHKQARQALRTRKTRERMDQWLRELRAQAYVEIRLEGGARKEL